ncbi:hypothetical protein BB561_004800 [Smittium simulii]|uniref:Uncharacterized protein n=1 Tax=Smittium simulii TaxID=133385 RepID=A0A2T9YE96_9FUNG|nr:hypothetical protein BB561_004800 [Smittium simulii]
MLENTIRIIQDHTNKVNELCMGRFNLNQKVDSILNSKKIHVVQERKYESMIVYPHISRNIPVTYLEVYPKLAEALPTIEENFFCSPLTDKEIKQAIFSCPKSSTIKCLLLSVNDTALATTKRADDVLYNLHATLDNITRPIDLFVHQKLLNNPEILPEDDNIVFAHTIKKFLSDLAITISHLRIDTRKQKKVCIYIIGSEETKKAGVSDKFKKNVKKFKEDVIHDFNNQDQRFAHRSVKTHKNKKNSLRGLASFYDLYRKNTSNVNTSSPRKINAETSFRNQKHSTSRIGYMNINILKNTTKNIERAVISARDTQIGNFYRLHIRIPAQERCRPLCVNISRQYYNALIRKKSWRYDFTQITQDSRNYLEILLINKYSTIIDLRTVNIKSSGCSKQANCTNEMANVGSNIHTAKQAVQRLRHRSIFISKQVKIINVLQLAPKPQGSRAKCLSTQLKIVGKPILLLTLEPDNTSDKENTPGENNTGNYNPVLKNCNMVSRPAELSIQQTLLLQATTNQRRALKNQGLGNYVVDFIVFNERRIRQRTRYNSAQQRFLEWKRFKYLTDLISAA